MNPSLDQQLRDRVKQMPPGAFRELIEHCIVDRDRLRAIDAQYSDLLFSVARKFPDESRHQTARRYIEEAEQFHYSQCAVADAAPLTPGAP